jgi:hypothetical protein
LPGGGLADDSEQQIDVPLSELHRTMLRLLRLNEKPGIRRIDSDSTPGDPRWRAGNRMGGDR